MISKRILCITLSLLLISCSQIVFADDIDINDSLNNGVEAGSDINNPIEVSSALQLFNIRNNENWNTKSYKLTNDIDLNDLTKLSNEEKTGGLENLLEGETWIPPKEIFYGEFDGNGHTIKNLTEKQFIVNSFPAGSIGFGGLFSNIGDDSENHAYIHDLTLSNVNIIYDSEIEVITNYTEAGAICSEVKGTAKIENCIVKNANISTNKSGAIVGCVNSGKKTVSINNCKVIDCKLDGTGTGNKMKFTVGGLIGELASMNYSESKIEFNEISNVILSFSGFNEGRNREICLGGLVGNFFNQSDFCIKNDYVNNVLIKGDVTGVDKNKIKAIYIGGAFGRLCDQNARNIEVKDLAFEIKNDESSELKIYKGGLVGAIVTTYSKQVLDEEMSDFLGEPIYNDIYIANVKSKLENCYVGFKTPNDKKEGNVLIGETLQDFLKSHNVDGSDSETYTESVNECFYDIGSYKYDITDQPTGVIPVTYAIVPKTAASDKAEDASAADDILNTKTSAAFTVKAYAVEKNEDGSVKYDETTGEPVVGDEIEGFMEKFGSAVSATDWRIAAGESIGDGEDAVKCDDAVTADNTSIKADSDGLGATLTSSANAGTKEAPANIIIAAKVNGVEKKLAVPYYYVRSHSSSGGGGGGSAATPTTETTTKTNADGSTTVTVKNNTTGTITETTTAKDGTKTVVETKKDGTVTTTVTKPNGTSLKTVKAADGSITISTGSKSAVKTEIPAAGAGAGTVAVRVKADGSEEIIKNSIVNDGKIIFMANDGDVIKIRNNGASFKDVAAGSWMSDAVAYVSGRELFKGVSDDEFGPSGSMTRGMLATVLYRYAGGTAAAAANGFSDIASGAYYADAVNWAAANGIVTGYSDGTFAPDKSVTREQLAAILYRYAGSPQEAAALDSFKDAGSVSDYAANAVAWAVKAGIISGNGDSATLDPQGTATRAQVATMIKRFAEYQMAQ